MVQYHETSLRVYDRCAGEISLSVYGAAYSRLRSVSSGLSKEISRKIEFGDGADREKAVEAMEGRARFADYFQKVMH